MFLAALVGCDLDNVIIELNASELPIMVHQNIL
jgi:UDP-3-O-[3-hydroxymyristoyl] N-acetylglucosamine deacetylase/3-hydroxyacyl-[acyl-carrier-protein] dehydratase